MLSYSDQYSISIAILSVSDYIEIRNLFSGKYTFTLSVSSIDLEGGTIFVLTRDSNTGF